MHIFRRCRYTTNQPSFPLPETAGQLADHLATGVGGEVPSLAATDAGAGGLESQHLSGGAETNRVAIKG